MPYTILSHTADTGIEATAGTFPELVAELATGMFALMASVPAAEGGRVEIELNGTNLADLVVDTLSELLYRLEVDDALFADFDITFEDGCLRVSAATVPLAGVDVTGPPIKAITYHDLVVEERETGWFARVYFDV